MSRVVLAQTLRASRRTLAILAFASAAFHYLVLLASDSFIADFKAPFLQQPPPAIEAFVGGNADFTTPAGWLALLMTHPITIAILHGAGLSIAAGAVATELERGTLDLVLSRPVGRRAYLLGKAGAVVVAVSVVKAAGLVGVLVARATIHGVGAISADRIPLAFGSSWVFFVALGMVGLLISATSSLRGRAIGLSVGVIVALFFANFIGLLIDEASGLRYASPFHYFQPGEILSGGGSIGDVVVLAGLAVVAAVAALGLFDRRDLSR